jgi:hypothetical protein
MNLSLTTLQRLLVLSTLIWAFSPRWGGAAFGSCVVMLALGTRDRNRRARLLLEANLDRLGALSPEGLTLVRRFPLAAVWPNAAERWGTTWQLTGLLSLFLGGIFLMWALGTQQWWHLGLLGVLVVQLFVGGTMAQRLKLNERVAQDLKQDKSAHDSAMTLVRLKTATGQWPPEPDPDPEPQRKTA